jgi:acetylornithine deacetylase/succinyl-diaminopimelate desuccinylase-like protein
VARAARAVYGVDPIVYPLSPGSGPLYTVCGTLGLPAIAVGISHAGSAAHGPNESIRDRDFLEGAKLIAAILESMDAGDQGEVTAP